MRKLFVLGAIIFAFAACSRDGMKQASVPSQVVTAFNERYPNATDVEWDREDNDYEVEFKEGDRKMEAVYAPDGKLKSVNESGRGMFGGKDDDQAKVPAAVINSFNANYPNATEVEWKEKGGEYKVQFRQGNEDLEATYSPDGRLKNFERD